MKFDAADPTTRRTKSPRPESVAVSVIVRNRKPGPPESDIWVPPVPDANCAFVPAIRAKFVPEVLFSNEIFKTAFVFVLMGIALTKYFPLAPTVPVMVITAILQVSSLGQKSRPFGRSPFGGAVCNPGMWPTENVFALVVCD